MNKTSRRIITAHPDFIFDLLVSSPSLSFIYWLGMALIFYRGKTQNFDENRSTNPTRVKEKQDFGFHLGEIFMISTKFFDLD